MKTAISPTLPPRGLAGRSLAAPASPVSTSPAPTPVRKHGTLRRAARFVLTHLNRACADFWMNFLFWHARRQPWFARWSKPFWMFTAWRISDHFYGGLMTNAARILGPRSTFEQQERLAKRTMANFYDFVCDIGFAVGCSRQQLLDQIQSVEGESHYLSARAQKRGAIIATAHMGSFEVGAAALQRHEKRIHVLFRTDQRNLFEQIRSTLRRRLGVVEVPVEQGWTVWIRLRDALQNDEAVLIQCDRVMPGQKGQAVPFFAGHTLFPTGPVKLALASGAPIIPVFTTKTPKGMIRLHVEPPIYVGEDGVSPDEALLLLAKIVEKYVRRFPDQWLANQPAWIEDQDRPTPRPPLVVKIERVKQSVRKLVRRTR